MAISRAAPFLALVVLVSPACTSGIEPAPADEACEQAKYAVASAQYACGIDPKDANAAYDRFGQTYVCVAASAQTMDFECAEQILATPCADATTRAADDVAYIASSSACGRIFRRADGAPLPLSTQPSRNPVCDALSHRIGDPQEACNYGDAQQYTYGEDGSSPQANFTADIVNGRAKLDAAYRCIATDPNTDPRACLDAIGCSREEVPADDVLLAPGAPCAALLAPRAGATP